MALLCPVQTATGRCKTRTGHSTARGVPRGSPGCRGRRQTHTWVLRPVAAISPRRVRLQTLGGAPRRATRVPAPRSVRSTACVSPEGHHKVKSDAFRMGRTGNGRRFNSPVIEEFASGALPAADVRMAFLLQEVFAGRGSFHKDRNAESPCFPFGGPCVRPSASGAAAASPSVIPRVSSPRVPDP